MERKNNRQFLGRQLRPAFFWLLCSLFLAGSVQAGTVKTVTSKADDGGEGTFRYIMNNLEDGDIIEFADNLANDTIKLQIVRQSDFVHAFGSADGGAGKSLTVRGNGVAILGGGNLFDPAMENLWVENIRFLHHRTTNVIPIVFRARNGRVKNCTFTPTGYDGASQHLVVTPAGENIIFEGCAFMSASPLQTSVKNTDNSNVSFVSCTFTKPAGSYHAVVPGTDFITHPEQPFISLRGAVEITNCVVMDFGGVPMQYIPPISSTIDVPADKLVSNGYNVIRDISSTAILSKFSAQADVVLPAGDAPPLTLDEGVWKVPLASPAYRRLAPKSVWEDDVVMGNVPFPEKDLSGALIDYTCKTHSGAWQTVYLAGGETEPAPECDGTAVTGITLTPPAGTIYTESGDYTITAAVEPADASPIVTWTSSNPSVATIHPDNGRITPVAAGTTTLTATSVAAPSVTASVEIEVHAYIHVTGVELPATLQFYNYMNNLKLITYRVLPDNALNKKINWTLDDPTGTLQMNTTHFAAQNQIYFIFKESAQSPALYETSGTATLTGTTEDGSLTATCTINIGHGDFTPGVFLVCEGNYATMPGLVNYLHPDGRWEDKIWGGGITKQFGTVYKDYFISIAKQNHDLSFVNAATMNTDIHSCRNALSDGDPRAFVGVDEHTGYLSTSNGVYVFSLDFGTELEVAPIGHITGSEGVGGEGNEGDGDGPLYQGQTGTMVRAGNYVFALHQTKGLLVIDPAVHQVVQTFTGTYNGLVPAADGNLWAGAGSNKLWRIDPWTLDMAEVTMTLPAGAQGPTATNWGSWRIESLMADPVANGLYWAAGGGDGSRFGPAYFYRYDIDAGTVAPALDLTAYDGDRWRSYGPTYGIHPVTGELYVAVYTGNGNKDYRMLKVNPASGSITTEYPMTPEYWFPSAVVFPDNAAPVIDASFPSTRTLNATNRYDTLALRPLVTDADQMPAAIVKTITAIGDRTLIDAFIRHDTLFISPLKDLSAPQNTTVALKFNSNGKVVEKTLSVTVQPGAIAHPVTGVALNHTAKELSVGETLQLTATVAPANADNKALTWTSSQPLVASVDASSGLVTAHLAPGTAVITATTVEGGFTATCVVTTKAAGPSTVPVTGVALNRTTAELTVGQTLALTATVAPANATNRAVTWTSSTPAVASVSSAGVVTAHIAPAAAVITATTADGGFTATCIVATKAADPVETNPFELNQHSLTLYPGQTVRLGLTAPQHFNVTWSSSNTAVATVSSAGEVRSISAGSAVITARDVAKDRVDMCAVTVLPVPEPVVESVTLNTSYLALTQGETATLQVTTSQGLAWQQRTWSASNPGVADVTASGMVITFAPGTSVIRVAIGNYSATCTVQVSAPRTGTEVDNITQNSAQLYLSTVANASYYLVHLYTKQGVSLVPVYTLKVMPDGSSTIVTLRAGGNSIAVPLLYLSPATSYIYEVEAIRETQGRADVIHTEMSAFTTASQTGVEDVADAQPKVWYTNGTLRLENLDGYVCTVMSMTGQHTHVFGVVSPDDHRRVQLQRGTYVLSAQKDGIRKVFKFVVY